jgi:hypothetical protein
MAEANKRVESLQKQHAELLEKSKRGDRAAFLDKAKVGAELREAQREANREGKRSLQEEYVRKFDGETPVEVSPKAGEPAEVTTLREHHAKRLLKK